MTKKGTPVREVLVFLRRFMDSPLCRPGTSETGGLSSRWMVVLWIAQAKQQHPSTKVRVGAHFIKSNRGTLWTRMHQVAEVCGGV